MNRTQLRSFHAVGLYGGFTAAARVLNVGQPTLTTQVRALEDRYQVELFHRVGRGVRLSQAGEELYKLTTRIEQLELETEELLQSYKGHLTGHLRIAAVGPFHATDMIVAFKSVFPLIEVSVQLGNSRHSFQRLLDFSADVGVIADTTEDHRVLMVPYRSHNVVLFVNADHPFFRLDSVSIHQLQNQKIVLREKGSTTRTALENALAKAGVQIEPVLEIGSREGVWKAVERGLGIGLVADFEFVPHPRLKVLPFHDISIRTQYFLAYLKERRESRMIQAFLEVASNVVPVTEPVR